MIRAGCSILAVVAATQVGFAAEATVAVAANFLTTAEELAASYTESTGHNILLAHGSTGRLYAQIVNGAPFDVFLSADTERPAALAEQGIASQPVTYALGRLVLISTRDSNVAVDPALDGVRVAHADPQVAPFGVAAIEALASFGEAAAGADIVLGDSVGQVAALFTTGNVPYAFIAESQLPLLGVDYTVLDIEGRYSPIVQDAVLLSSGAENPAASGFLDYLVSEDARGLIVNAGYGAPE